MVFSCDLFDGSYLCGVYVNFKLFRETVIGRENQRKVLITCDANNVVLLSLNVDKVQNIDISSKLLQLKILL